MTNIYEIYIKIKRTEQREEEKETGHRQMKSDQSPPQNMMPDPFMNNEWTEGIDAKLMRKNTR